MPWLFARSTSTCQGSQQDSLLRSTPSLWCADGVRCNLDQVGSRTFEMWLLRLDTAAASRILLENVLDTLVVMQARAAKFRLVPTWVPEPPLRKPTLVCARRTKCAVIPAQDVTLFDCTDPSSLHAYRPSPEDRRIHHGCFVHLRDSYQSKWYHRQRTAITAV